MRNQRVQARVLVLTPPSRHSGSPEPRRPELRRGADGLLDNPSDGGLLIRQQLLILHLLLEILLADLVGEVQGLEDAAHAPERGVNLAEGLVAPAGAEAAFADEAGGSGCGGRCGFVFLRHRGCGGGCADGHVLVHGAAERGLELAAAGVEGTGELGEDLAGGVLDLEAALAEADLHGARVGDADGEGEAVTFAVGVTVATLGAGAGADDADVGAVHAGHGHVLLVADGLGADAEGADSGVAVAEDEDGVGVDDDGLDEGLQRRLVRDAHQLVRHHDRRPVRVGRDHRQVDLAEPPRRPAQIDREGRERGARRTRVGRARLDGDVEGAILGGSSIYYFSFPSSNFRDLYFPCRFPDGRQEYLLFGDVSDPNQGDGELAVAQDELDDILEGAVQGRNIKREESVLVPRGGGGLTMMMVLYTGLFACF